MNAYQMDDYDVWAANSIEEAVSDYERETGGKVDPEEVRQLTDAELDADIPEFDENEQPTGKMTTIRSWLADMTKPGFLGSSCW